MNKESLKFLGISSFTVEDYADAYRNNTIEIDVFRRELNKALRNLSKTRLVEFMSRFTK